MSPDISAAEIRTPNSGHAPEIDDRPSFDNWLLAMAQTSSLRSRDPSTKVGAVIVRPDKSIASLGYNGFPRGMEDRPEWYADRSEKYGRIVHAEMNALLSLKESARGMTLAMTHPPCGDCAKHIAAAGIARVIWRHCPQIAARFNTRRSEDILRDSGVEITILGDGEAILDGAAGNLGSEEKAT